MMKTAARVILVTFNGSSSAPADTPPGEDYWKMIGSHGTLIDGKEESARFPSSGPEARVCVEFDCDPSLLGLESHNRVKKSLWIRCRDLHRSEEPNHSSQPTTGLAPGRG
jgi:hypothetical protein